MLRLPPLICLAACALLAGEAAAQAPPLRARLVVSGLQSPTAVTAPPGDMGRLFLTEKNVLGTGRIRLFDRTTGTLQPAPYLTVGPVAGGIEQGLLGLAFHPNFAANGLFYVHYTAADGTGVIGRYQALPPYATSVAADPASFHPILTFTTPQPYHQGGWLGFGPNLKLYVALGDGGDPANGQDLGSLLGKILRIDLYADDFPADPVRNYSIPPSNPFAGAVPGADEVWHYGLRNPWRASFDRATSELYIGDVGESDREEIDVGPRFVGGLNFGWPCLEGTLCTGTPGCACGDPSLAPPVHEYGHAAGDCSVIGGHVYRGSAICGLEGTYFYGDFCTGNVWSFRQSGGIVTDLVDRSAELNTGLTTTLDYVTSFGEDAAGEIFVCDTQGEIFQIVAGPISDCNANGQHDACDVVYAASADLDGDQVPDECQPVGTRFCSGDGTAAACPCGNSGGAGRGCANSVEPAGGDLSAVGVPSVSADGLFLASRGMPSSSYALYFQGTLPASGGNGVPFGDGLRCAAGSIERIGAEFSADGSSHVPGPSDPPISVSGHVLAGGQTRTYQVWYRNASPVFCTPSTFNLTNGLSIFWVN